MLDKSTCLIKLFVLAEKTTKHPVSFAELNFREFKQPRERPRGNDIKQCIYMFYSEEFRDSPQFVRYRCQRNPLTEKCKGKLSIQVIMSRYSIRCPVATA